MKGGPAWQARAGIGGERMVAASWDLTADYGS